VALTLEELSNMVVERWLPQARKEMAQLFGKDVEAQLSDKEVLEILKTSLELTEDGISGNRHQ